MDWNSARMLSVTAMDESSALACRGLAVILCTDQTQEPTSPDYSINLVEFLVRRLKHVVRSTFGGELNALLDTAENVLLMQLAYHDILYGCEEDAEGLMARLEAGELQPPCDFVTDWASVFEAIRAAGLATPTEASLKLH